ncbi:hypothetical protein F511_11795 [Dorcoceras hygrometricum]|uniref:Uncharacterized protein n=1 Tax=Dorcoceras hygrometricum TaxID=472368 RepID=A0A2Z7CET3_9LAMI|nr:hypothetical protein F511_11795 [Dorcoceras hygrometricum]
MTSKRIHKLIQNIRRGSMGQDSSNRRQDGDESQEITSQDASETQNGALQSPQEEDFYEEGSVHSCAPSPLEACQEPLIVRATSSTGDHYPPSLIPGPHNSDDEVVRSPRRQQNRRGRTVMKDVHVLHPDDLLFITFNERGQPYGDLQPVLANYVGTIGRNGTLLPLSFLDWRKIPKNRLEESWKLVIIYSEAIDYSVILDQEEEERIDLNFDSNDYSPVPHKLAPKVWERLCQYWKANEFKENGRYPTRIEILQLSRRSKKKKRGAPVDEEAVRYENLLDEAVQHRLQDMPEGTQPIEVHADAFRDVFVLEHSGRVRCLGAGATPSQVFPDQCRRSSFYRPNDNSDADVTENLRAMEEKMKKDMEARESQWRAQMEAQKAQLQIEIERMRQTQEQFQAFARVIENIIPGTGGGSHGPEILDKFSWSITASTEEERIGSANHLKRSITAFEKEEVELV